MNNDYKQKTIKDKEQTEDGHIARESMERCVSCGIVTDIPVDKDISERSCYVPGIGQLCKKCCMEIYGTIDLKQIM